MAMALLSDGSVHGIGVSNRRIMDILCWDATVLSVSWVLSMRL